MTDRGDPVLRLSEARFCRDGAASAVVVEDFELRAGESVAVVGPSGAGKSTLLEGVLGLQRPGGAVRRIAGVCERPERITWLPQDAAAAFDPTARLDDQLARAAAGRDRSARLAALRGFGVAFPEQVLQRIPAQVSGGELRRVLLALAALRSDPLLLVDEPTEGLDAPRIEQACTELVRLLEVGHRPAALVVTHDPQVAARLAQRVVSLVSGRLGAGGAPPIVDWAAEARAASGAAQPSGAASAPGEAAVLLEARQLSVGRGSRILCAGLELRLGTGEILALLGPSGVGKTSLARVLLGLDRPAAGAVHRALPAGAAQLVAQDAAGSLTPGIPVGQQVAEVAHRGFDLEAHRVALGLDAALLQRPVHELSGGEARRVALLRALAHGPRLLAVDEPTAHLDSASARRVVALLSGHAGVAPPPTQLWITHDDALAAHRADRVVRLEPDGDRAVLVPCDPTSSNPSPSSP